MNKLLFAILVLFVSSVFSQGVDDFKNGIDFTGSGTEPFWSVKIDFEKGIFFNSADGVMKFETGIPESTPVKNKEGVIYTAKSIKYEVKVQTTKEPCSDGMSDNSYPYSVKININNIDKNERTELSGCGNYTYDYRLDDIWVLEKFKGSEIKKEQYSKTKPYIEIKIKDSRIGGNTGCNEFYGTIEIMGDKIIISNKISLTKMACPDIENFETDFIQAISGKTYSYKIEDMKLYFMENEEVILQFRKVD
jgi:uncharacterized membrane protein/heat shock protein HslJ